MRRFNIPDSEFIRGKVPMTKEEIRILTIAKANICPEDVVLDVGAGTGSLSCEAALHAYNGQVYAIERKAEGIELIKANTEKLGIGNIKVIIGGSGSKLAPILDKIDGLLVTGGRIVLNCITIQTLSQCLEYMRQREDYEYAAVQVQVSRWKQVGPYDMAEAMNPIFIVTCVKK